MWNCKLVSSRVGTCLECEPLGGEKQEKSWGSGKNLALQKVSGEVEGANLVQFRFVPKNYRKIGHKLKIVQNWCPIHCWKWSKQAKISLNWTLCRKVGV